MSVGLVEEVRRPEGRMGIVYLKGIDASLDPEVFSSPALYFPRGATKVVVVIEGDRRRFEVDAKGLLVLPPRRRHRISCKTSVLELAVLLPDASVIEEVSKLYEQPLAAVEEAFALAFTLERSRWLDEIHHRYVFERVVCERQDNVATSFLETEIAKEIHFGSVQARDRKKCVPVVFDANSPARRAISFIEQNLFETIDLDVVAEHAGASRSTLLRSFRKELGTSPQQYVRDRRLDEATTLLSSGRTVSEVAALIGYDSVSAFSQAFRRKFKRTPTEDGAQTAAPRRRRR